MFSKNCKYCNEEHINNNTGCKNSGDYNSGNRNSGNRNSGDYNSGNYNSGWFNTNEPKIRFFNKDSVYTHTEFYEKFNFIYPDLKICAWVNLDYLSKDEQTESAKQMGGLLKTLTYKEAWAEYWNRASNSDKEWFKNLPNFDASIFEEITGIKINSPETLKIGEYTYDKNQVEQALKNIKPL